MTAEAVDTGRVAAGTGTDRISALAGWPSLAAAPLFCAMALWHVVRPPGSTGVCAAAHGSPLDGMEVMYALMAAVHLTPWLRRVARGLESRL